MTYDFTQMSSFINNLYIFMNELKYKPKHISDPSSKYFSYYFYGFPSKFSINDLLPVKKLLKPQLNLFETFKNKTSIPGYNSTHKIVLDLLDTRLKRLNATHITSASDFLCILDAETLNVGFCSLDYFNWFYSNFRFLFDGIDSLELSYIYNKCLYSALYLDHFNQSILVKAAHEIKIRSSLFCPNRCRPLFDRNQTWVIIKMFIYLL